VTLRYGTESKDLNAFGYCYGTICVDGFPPKPLPAVGSPKEVMIDFPLAGWSFDAMFEPSRESCGRTQTVALERTGDGSFVLKPAGFAGTYDVTLFGRGDGDLVTAFRWSTPSDGPLPVPEASLALIAGQGNEIDSYGVELLVSNLAETPARAIALVTVTAANQESLTFAATQVKRCWAEGTVYWDGPDQEGLAAADLGPPPFRYRVKLSLDGRHYAATAVWPADEIKGNEPSVTLTFDPPLPSLTGDGS